MSTHVVFDPVRKMAALVADDPPYALGPVVAADTAEEAQEAIDGFLGGLPSPADEMPTIKLMQDWNLYIQALYELADRHEVVDAPDPTVPSTSREGNPDAQPSAPHAETSGESAETPSGPEPPEVESTPAVAFVSPETGAHEPTEIRDTDREVACWACKDTPGEFHLNGEVHPCSVCKGTARLPV